MHSTKNKQRFYLDDGLHQRKAGTENGGYCVSAVKYTPGEMRFNFGTILGKCKRPVRGIASVVHPVVCNVHSEGNPTL